MTALRIPFATGSGVLCTLTLFTVLFHFVSQPIDVGPIAEPLRLVFTPQIKASPTVTKRTEKPEREPPRLEPAGPRIGGPPTDGVKPTAHIPRHEVARPAKGGGLPVSGGDRDVLPLFRVTPDYPQQALKNETEGWVKVQFSITAAGAVKDAVVVESEPGTTFDEAALKAINRWRYNPRVENGVAVERVGLQTVIRFELE
jgi:protein TonB